MRNKCISIGAISAICLALFVIATMFLFRTANPAEAALYIAKSTCYAETVDVYANHDFLTDVPPDTLGVHGPHFNDCSISIHLRNRISSPLRIDSIVVTASGSPERILVPQFYVANLGDFGEVSRRRAILGNSNGRISVTFYAWPVTNSTENARSAIRTAIAERKLSIVVHTDRGVLHAGIFRYITTHPETLARDTCWVVAA